MTVHRRSASAPTTRTSSEHRAPHSVGLGRNSDGGVVQFGLGKLVELLTRLQRHPSPRADHPTPAAPPKPPSRQLATSPDYWWQCRQGSAGTSSPALWPPSKE